MSLFDGIALLNPQGWVGLQERALMLHAVEFMLIVAVPVYGLIFFFAWRYRAGNTKAAYLPNWEHSKMDELVWWAVPFEIILVLGALTWTSTHQLDPKIPLSGPAPMVVEVVALNWKWLFIYPEQDVATVNYLRMPVGKPVRFEITADAPMNSFWIPSLGGQIYAMTGMVTTLNLVADNPGSYPGSSSNYSGSGFAQMKFVAEATSQEDFDAWVSSIKEASSSVLTPAAYAELAQPSVVAAPEYFGGVDPSLYNSIVMKFMDMNTHTDDMHMH